MNSNDDFVNHLESSLTGLAARADADEVPARLSGIQRRHRAATVRTTAMAGAAVLLVGALGAVGVNALMNPTTPTLPADRPTPAPEQHQAITIDATVLGDGKLLISYDFNAENPSPWLLSDGTPVADDANLVYGTSLSVNGELVDGSDAGGFECPSGGEIAVRNDTQVGGKVTYEVVPADAYIVEVGGMFCTADGEKYVTDSVTVEAAAPVAVVDQSAGIDVVAEPAAGSISVSYAVTTNNRSPRRGDDGSILPGGGEPAGGSTILIDGEIVGGTDMGAVACDPSAAPIQGTETSEFPAVTFDVAPGDHTVEVRSLFCTAEGDVEVTSDPVTVTVP